MHDTNARRDDIGYTAQDPDGALAVCRERKRSAKGSSQHGSVYSWTASNAKSILRHTIVNPANVAVPWSLHTAVALSEAVGDAGMQLSASGVAFASPSASAVQTGMELVVKLQQATIFESPSIFVSTTICRNFSGNGPPLLR